MISPVKLYKADKKVARKAVTWGPRGAPKSSSAGTACYRHPCIDWSVHRLTPALAGDKKGTLRHKAVGEVTARMGTKKDVKWRKDSRKDPKGQLMKTSPRWGDGYAPGRRTRKVVPLPPKHEIEVSTKTKVAAGAVAGAVGARKSSHKGKSSK